jgi:5-methylcytosine-specific restriction endonuclease McrA
MIAKVCLSCGEPLSPSSEFFPYRRGRLQQPCKQCCRSDARERYAARRSQARARSHDYHCEHRSSVLARKRSHYKANSETICAKVRAYYASHRTQVSETSRSWRESHHEENATYSRNYLARLRNAPGSHTAADVLAQYDRQRGRCYWCEEKVTWRAKHVDHVMPIVKGGSNGPENVVIACSSCNQSKGAKHPMDFAGVLC